MIYQPAEDSYLLQEVLKKKIKKLLKENQELSVLEIGPGSGIQLETLKELGVKRILAVDINPESVKHCTELGFNCIKSNLFENIKEKFNVILFNPPYLPRNPEEDEESQIATTGGKKGSEVVNKFLKQAKDFLKKDGKIFLLTSDLTKDIFWRAWKKKKIARKKIFFEELSIWELTN